MWHMHKRLSNCFTCIGLIYILFASAVGAGTFKLNDGTVLEGELVSPNELGAVISHPDGSYSSRIHWSMFSQEDLKRLAQNPKLKQLVEPFIDDFDLLTPQTNTQKEIKLNPVPRLPVPMGKSLLGALLGSGPGLAILLLLYLANIYAAYEIAIVRARPVAGVCALAAVFPVITPIIFLLSPPKVDHEKKLAVEKAAAEQTHAQMAAEVASASATILGTAKEKEEQEKFMPLPPPQVFKRGEFVFNRRFFETRFSGFFTVVRREADRDMVLTIRTSKGLFVVERITRITANDMHALVRRGPSMSEVQISFPEILEVEYRHKDVPSQIE